MTQTTRPTRCEVFFLSDSDSALATFKHPDRVTVWRYQIAPARRVWVELLSIRYIASFARLRLFHSQFCSLLFSFCPYDVRINTPVTHTTRHADRCSGHVTTRRWWKCLLLISFVSNSPRCCFWCRSFPTPFLSTLEYLIWRQMDYM